MIVDLLLGAVAAAVVIWVAVAVVSLFVRWIRRLIDTDDGRIKRLPPLPTFDPSCTKRSLYAKSGFVFAGRRLKLDAYDIAAWRFLRFCPSGELLVPGDESQVRLLRFKHELHELIAARPLCGLIFALGEGVNRALAIWLLGRCGGRIAAVAVARHRFDDSPRIRREVARALVRLDASAEIEHILAEETDARVLATAAAPRRRSFGERLERFLGPESRRLASTEASPMPFALYVPLDEPHPPKSAGLIRRILERIRALVGEPGRRATGNGA